MDTKGSQGGTLGVENTIQKKKRAVLYHYHSFKLNTCHFKDQIGISLSLKLKKKKKKKEA